MMDRIALFFLKDYGYYIFKKEYPKNNLYLCYSCIFGDFSSVVKVCI